MPDPMHHPELEPLRRRAEEEETAYAAALAELDALAALPLPPEGEPGLRATQLELNELRAGDVTLGETETRLGRMLRQRVLALLRPLLERQDRFESALVRLLNAHVDRQAHLEVALRRLAAGLVSYAQRVEPMMEARDDARVAAAPTEAEQVLRAFERRLNASQERSEALLALRDRVESLSEELRALRSGLEAQAPTPEAAQAATRAAQDAVYTAFENRFRGERSAVRGRQQDYVELFRGGGPVLDLGCGRGEFLDLLRSAGIEARGVETNAAAVRECRARGLVVDEADLVAALRVQAAASLGGVFAAQVVEHLPPAALVALLAEAHRALRPGGRLVLETVNAASGLAFLDIFIRDLTHERPLHPETLRFLAAAAGFLEARIELRSPVPDEVRLRLLPSGSLAPPVVQVLNENAERLNTLLFAPVDYALVATR